MPKIAIILGSSRQSNNGAGFASWLSPLLDTVLNESHSPVSDSRPFSIVLVDPTVAPHPLGPVIDGTRIPAEIRDPTLYASPAVRAWSALVSSCDAFVILTPQYNWSFPGELKNALDHLYWEWHGKPVLLVTYGGHGGSNKNIEITLPKEYISGGHRVPADGLNPEFLLQYEPAVRAAAREMQQMLLHEPVPVMQHHN
ncbi:NAD(P)H-dependent FMN reductase LOT6 [Grifola frondosa]|uniref:NAD(P)H-dependent FMN reductase LOT6 n=1 Tax=Grifola frondosa TaxID=5627 RepID=A0A1C7MRS5_GRIFR|nr:NAD(P)H-dependent FMN reductase LOT6 [Grifola frondosa]